MTLDKLPDCRNTGPGYFGKMAAAMSHELKNCLAIMNENNGLIQDFTALAAKGRPLDPDRLSQVAERISRQIGRADGLLKQMNLFAHSVDHPAHQVVLDDAAVLAANLGARLAANRQVAISTKALDEPVTLTLPFFVLLNLIWQTMEAMMAVMAPQTDLVVRTFKDKDVAGMEFGASNPFTEPVEPALEAADVHHLCTGVGAQMTIGPETGRIILTFGTQTD